jgi:hypothetical protein
MEVMGACAEVACDGMADVAVYDEEIGTVEVEVEVEVAVGGAFSTVFKTSLLIEEVLVAGTVVD